MGFKTIFSLLTVYQSNLDTACSGSHAYPNKYSDTYQSNLDAACSESHAYSNSYYYAPADSYSNGEGNSYTHAHGNP